MAPAATRRLLVSPCAILKRSTAAEGSVSGTMDRIGVIINYFALGLAAPPPLVAGVGTGIPASTDDCSDVGGSKTGCGVGWSAPEAKSRAAVPGSGPRYPSLTAVVLALSSGGSVE
jgi:hypothetical protein